MTTEKTPHRWTDVLRAIADGEEVQFLSMVLPQEWTTPANDNMNPISHPNHEWRIAPKKQKKHTVWVNVYFGNNNNCFFYTNKDAANFHAGTGRVACVPLTFTEGEGLD